MSTSETIDQATFDKFLESLGGDVDFLSELADTYLSSSSDIFSEMQRAIASGEASALQRAAHSLKSGSANFGALSFAAQCREMEEIGKAGQLDGVEEKYKMLLAAYDEVATELQQRVKNARSAPA